MESDALRFLDQAEGYFKSADHLRTVTYSLVKDVKLFPGIVDLLAMALEASLDALLSAHTVHFSPPTFECKLRAAKTIPHTSISPELWQSVERLQQIRNLHQKSAVSFPRGKRYVITEKEYALHTISEVDVRAYCSHVRECIDLMRQSTAEVLNRK